MPIGDGSIIIGAQLIDNLNYQVIDQPAFTDSNLIFYESLDFNYSVESQAGIANNFSIVGNVTKIISRTPDVCRVNGTSVEMISPGNAEIELHNNYCKKIYRRVMSSSNGVVNRFISFKPGSLRGTIYQGMVDALGTLGGIKNPELQKASVNNSGPAFSGTFGGFNPSNFLTQPRLSYIPPPLDSISNILDSGGGPASWRAWITPHHFLTWRGHGIGDGVEYKQINGEIVVQYSDARWNGSICKMMPADVYKYAPQGNAIGVGLPCYSRLYNTYESGYNRVVQPVAWGDFQKISEFIPYQYRNSKQLMITGGDSGSPVFTILNGDLIPLGHVAYAGIVGYLPYHEVLGRIQQIVDHFNAKGSYQIQTVDLSAFPQYI